MWQEVSYLGATLLLSYVVHLFLFTHKGDGGPLFWWRWARLVVELWVERISRQPRMRNYDSSGTTYELSGFEATPSEKELEQPKPLTTDRTSQTRAMSMCVVKSGEGRG
ncbi:hypothetical protein Hamer_G010814 [Homarus americanus]|uniref:Uncharacterized protein n=1 Tax=Homarus americanus TaxID=6706 RepID=A0A8J5JQC7_HOMAM|nr:hypothetical protein Hamer_G010814 [Homarus americanus]